MLGTVEQQRSFSEQSREISRSDIAQMTYDQISGLPRNEMIQVIDSAFECQEGRLELLTPQASNRALRSLAQKARWHCRELGY